MVVVVVRVESRPSCASFELTLFGRNEKDDENAKLQDSVARIINHDHRSIISSFRGDFDGKTKCSLG